MAHLRDKVDAESAPIAKVVAPEKIAVLSGDAPEHLSAAINFLRDCGGSVLNLYSLSNTPHYCRERMTVGITAAAKAGLRVRWTGFDINRLSSAVRREQVSAAIDAGANVISLPDSLGVETPTSFADLAQEMKQWCGDTVHLALHCHDDRGHAVSNSLAGIKAGADEVECTLGGVGTRQGNCSLLALIGELDGVDSTEFDQLVDLETRIINAGTPPPGSPSTT